MERPLALTLFGETIYVARTTKMVSPNKEIMSR